ncbi:MAG: hypothetical protein WKG07_40005 [Hymenobacter sp.]
MDDMSEKTTHEKRVIERPAATGCSGAAQVERDIFALNCETHATTENSLTTSGGDSLEELISLAYTQGLVDGYGVAERQLKLPYVKR